MLYRAMVLHQPRYGVCTVVSDIVVRDVQRDQGRAVVKLPRQISTALGPKTVSSQVQSLQSVEFVQAGTEPCSKQHNIFLMIEHQQNDSTHPRQPSLKRCQQNSLNRSLNQ